MVNSSSSTMDANKQPVPKQSLAEKLAAEAQALKEAQDAKNEAIKFQINEMVKFDLMIKASINAERAGDTEAVRRRNLAWSERYDKLRHINWKEYTTLLDDSDEDEEAASASASASGSAAKGKALEKEKDALAESSDNAKKQGEAQAGDNNHVGKATLVEEASHTVKETSHTVKETSHTEDA